MRGIKKDNLKTRREAMKTIRKELVCYSLKEILDIAEKSYKSAYPIEYIDGTPMPKNEGKIFWKSIAEAKRELIENDPLPFLEDSNDYWIANGFIMKCNKNLCHFCNAEAFISIETFENAN